MFLSISGKKIYYKIEGSGKPLILIHGWGGSSKSLIKLSNLLSFQFKTILIDLPGFGLSDNPDSDWGVEEYANFLIDFLNQIRIQKTLYFGHSFGGSLGIYLAVRYPKIIDKLILCASSYKRTNKSSRFSKYFYKSPKIFKKILYKIFFPSSDLFKYPHLESNFRKILSQDLSSYLVMVNQPTLILWGKDDKEIPETRALEAKDKIINVRLKIFPDIGHDLPLKYPQLVAKEILKFYKT